MGHADRPWLHNALGLDTQSRRVCLPSPWRCDSNTNTNGYTYSDSDGNTYSDSDGNTNGNSNRNSASNSNSNSNSNRNSNRNSASYAYPNANGHSSATYTNSYGDPGSNRATSTDSRA